MIKMKPSPRRRYDLFLPNRAKRLWKRLGKTEFADRENSKAYFGRRLKRLDDAPIPEDPTELRLFMVVRNGALRLPYLLEYYRRRGVHRFFVIDNDSTDDTVAILRNVENTHVFETSDAYSKTECGVQWVEYLMDRHCRDQWSVIVDSDELLVYPGWENVSLNTLTAFLDTQSATALHSLLLDMYSDRPLNDTVYTPGQDFLELCPYFEVGHRSMRDDGNWEGGVRNRLFGARNILSKHNLVKHISGSRIGGGTHLIYGAKFSDMTGVTLHFKYFHDFAESARVEIERGEHWNNAWQYKRYFRKTQEVPNLTLFCDESIRLKGSQQLIDLGLMTSMSAYDDFCAEAR